MIKRCFKKMFDSAMNLNKVNILQLLEVNKNIKLLDLGCDDGLWTMELAKKIKTTQVYGVDIVDERLRLAEQLGVKVRKGDLNNKGSRLADYL